MTWLFTAVCLIGTVLNVKKMKLCFVMWIIGNIAWMIYDLSTDLYSRAALDLVQLLLAVWGLIEWYIDDKKEKGNKEQDDVNEDGTKVVC